MRRHLKLWLFAGLVSVFQIAYGNPKSPVQPFDGVCSGTTRGYHTLLTGIKDGYYFKVGRAIALVADEQCRQDPSSCLRICAQESPETLNNFKALSNQSDNKRADSYKSEFAIVQGDVAHDAWFGHPLGKANEKIDGKDVRLVTPLYVEVVHILLRPHLNITSLEGLRGKRVWLGDSGSSTEYTARRMLSSAGLNVTPLNCENVVHPSDELDATVVTCISIIQRETGVSAFDSAVTELKAGHIDALFKIGPVPSKEIKDTLLPAGVDPVEASESTSTGQNLSSDFQLLPLDYSIAHQFARSGSGGYVERLIQKDSYDQDQSTLTIGVPALLLTRLGDNHAVSALARLIRENRERIEAQVTSLIEKEEELSGEQGHKHPFRLDLVNVAFRNLPLHGMAKLPKPKWEVLPWLLLGLVAVIPPLWSIVHKRQRKMVLNLFVVVSALGHSVIIAFALLLLSCCAGALWLQHYEKIVNENFRSFPLSVWSTVQQSTPILQSQMVTPDGESTAGIVAWLVRGVFFFGMYRVVKEKYGQRIKKWMWRETKKLEKQNRKGSPVPIHIEIQSDPIHEKGAD